MKGWHTCDQHCFNENLWTVAVTDSVLMVFWDFPEQSIIIRPQLST